MAVYSPEHQYIFFANPQTASKAIALTLREKLQGRALPDKEVVRDGKTIARKHHTTYSQVLAADLLSEEQLRGLFKFTCVRNPFDQLVSKYLKHCERHGNDPTLYPWLEGVSTGGREHSFPEWLVQLRDRYARIDKLAKGPLEFLAHADLVIRFEALQAGFDEFLACIGVSEPLSVTEFNVTKSRVQADEQAPAAPKRKKNYTEYYDDDCVALVETLYEPIIQRFNYRFGA